MDVAAGLHWLHSHRIVHFDVKSQNILLARDGTAKISDVGLARILHRRGGMQRFAFVRVSAAASAKRRGASQMANSVVPGS